MKISEEDKKLVLQAQQIFPEVWVFLRGQAKRGTRWCDLMEAIKAILRVGPELETPWRFVNHVLREEKRKREQKGIDQRNEERQKRKFKEKEDLMGCKLGDLIRGIDE